MNQSVIKALQLLKLFDEKQTEWTLKEIAEKAELPKATAYRLLSSLEQEDFLARDPEPNGKYRLGLRLLELGNLVADQLDIRRIAKPYMEELGQEINEAVHGYPKRLTCHLYRKVESNRAIRLYTQVGKSSPLYIGSGPKLLLAFMDETEQNHVFMHEPLRSIKNGEPIDQEKLQQELKKIKKQGYSISYGEQDEDTVGISYPIYNHLGHVISALTISGLSQHFEGERLTDMKRKIQHTATQISIALGAPKK